MKNSHQSYSWFLLLNSLQKTNIMTREGQQGRYSRKLQASFSKPAWHILLPTNRMLCFRESYFTSTNRKLSSEDLTLYPCLSPSLLVSDYNNWVKTLSFAVCHNKSRHFSIEKQRLKWNPDIAWYNLNEKIIISR